jgi:hypothetical protein
MAPQQGLVYAGFKLKRINGGRAEKPATEALLLRALLSNSALFRNNAVPSMLHATSLSTKVQLDYGRDMRVSACEYNMLLVTPTLGVYIGKTRRAR